MSLETYGLDPIHYYNLPALSWNAMLKYTGVELDLITDPDMRQMVGKITRGDISNISRRYATSNLPSMDTCNGDEEPRTLTSLYSWAMSQILPLKGFNWISAPDEIDILNVPEDSKLEYILEVDLEYPKELHDKHNIYTLAPEHVHVTDDMPSPLHREHFPPIRGSVRKFVPNLHNKKYVVHFRNLQLHVSLGMMIKKIHRVI